MCNLFIIRMAIVVFNELYPERQITFEPFVHYYINNNNKSNNSNCNKT